MISSHNSLYPVELSRFLADQNKWLIDPVSLSIDESLFPHEPIWITHAKRLPADPVPPWTLKQVLMPWTRSPLTPAQRVERKLQD